MKKEYGIKTGSRHFQIPHDPKIHIVEARIGTYLEYSAQVPKILNRYVPMENITPYSIDEGRWSAGMKYWLVSHVILRS